MSRKLWAISTLTVLVYGLSDLSGQTPPPPPTPAPMPGAAPATPAALPKLPDLDAPEKKYEDFAKLTKGAKEYDGLFKLHLKDDHLYAEIRPDQFDKPFLAPIAIARGAASGGTTLNMDEQWVLAFKKVGDKIHLIRRNVRYKAKKDTPAAVAVETNYTDSVLMALKIRSMNPMKGAFVIDLADIFLTDFAQLGLGVMDKDRSTIHKVKAFPKNVEIQIAATFSARGRGLDGVIDSRGATVIIHYGLVQLAESGYQPRLADDRVGYFVTAVKDYSSESKDTSFVRYINRWRLERADGQVPKEGQPLKLSPPKKKIVFWIEKSVPDEYRQYVRDGILEWNKAFEKIGFRDAIEVRQQETEDFDPEDMNYNTFRWITTDQGYAIGPSRVNPFTGEILDADILMDADMVRFWKTEKAVFTPQGTVDLDGPLSRIDPWRGRGVLPEWNDRSPTARWKGRYGFCECGPCKRQELALAGLALIARGMLPGDGDKVPEDLVGQAIKEVTMHEVGHTLGLRHNFKASGMLKNSQLHDTAVTRKVGITGSVMDYAPVNIAPKGVKQGDFFSTTIGPYDYWAIEYGYRPLSGGTEGEKAELAKIASKCTQPGLEYGTDEDVSGTNDPLINRWDLGEDNLQFAKDRLQLAQELMAGLADRVVEKGEGYQRTRTAFSMLMRQYGDAAALVSQYVGGESAHRDHRGDPNARDPFIPIKAAKQREALKFLQDNILTDKSFNFPPDVLRKLAADRWYHWGNERSVFGSTEYPIYSRVLGIQRIVLSNVMSGATLARIQEMALRAEKDEKPLTVAETLRGLTDTVWADAPLAGKPTATSSVIRRNLQREHLKRLATLVLGPKPPSGAVGILVILFDDGGRAAPPDARSLARSHLRELSKRLEAAMKADKLDETVRAHFEECHEQIAKVLAASMQVQEP